MKAQILQVIEDILDGSESTHLLLAQLKSGNISDSERVKICNMLRAALVQGGLESNDEPNHKGRSIEAAIDEVNRPLLHRSTPHTPQLREHNTTGRN